MTGCDHLKELIREVPDFPKPGVLFRDISPLLADKSAWRATIEQLAEIVRPHKPDLLAGIESRGFLVTASGPDVLQTGERGEAIAQAGQIPQRRS